MTKKIWKSPLKHTRSFSQNLFIHQKHFEHSHNQFVSYGQRPNLQSFFGLLCASLGFERRVYVLFVKRVAIFPMVSPFLWPTSLIPQTLVEPWVVFSLSFYFYFYFFCGLQKWSSIFFSFFVLLFTRWCRAWSVEFCFVLFFLNEMVYPFSSRKFFPFFSSFPYCPNQTCP
jgi:hypothetical protein